MEGPTMNRGLRFCVAGLLGLAVALAGVGPAQAGKLLWSKKLDQEVNWHRVTHLGTLLVGTDDRLSCLDPETGEPLWVRDDLKKLATWNVEEIPGTPLLLTHVNLGTVQAKTSLHAVDILTGQDRWQTEQLRGVTVDSFPVHAKGYVVTITVPAPAAKSKLDFTALDFATGKVVWEAEFEDKVDLHVAESSGRFMVKYDLSGHQPPVFDGDSLYFGYAGLHRYDAATGKLVWKNSYDVTEGTIKLGNAQMIVDGDTIYTSAKAQLRAIDKATGQTRWTSKDFGGAVAQMDLADDAIYGRLGGNFYDKVAKEWKRKKPFGVVAVNKKDGVEIWRYDDAKESITNMVLPPGTGTVLIADAKNLIGLNIAAQGKAQEAFKVKLEFKDKIGAGKIAAGVGRFLLGGLNAVAKSKDNDEDPPVAIEQRQNGVAVIRGKQHLLAFDTKAKQIAWSVQYEAPGVAAWAKAIMATLTAVTYAGNAGMAASTGSQTYAWNASNSIADYSNYAGKRFSAASASERYVYILTNVKEGEEKGAGIVGVNLDTGKADRQVMFKEKEPKYEVDEVTGRVFNVKDDKNLMAFSVR